MNATNASELSFRHRVERHALPSGSPWFDPFRTNPELGKVYFFAILSWSRTAILPNWKVGLLRWGSNNFPELGLGAEWVDLHGHKAFPNLDGQTIIDSFPRVLLALDGSFGEIPENDYRTDQIYRCVVAKKSLDDWALQLNPPAS